MKRKGRARGRPLAVKEAMHLVLRSTQAKGNWSFQRPHHKAKIRELIQKFSQRHGVRVFHLANVGNHLHLQIQLSHRRGFAPFIRALTSAIAMAMTGHNRWNKVADKFKFWDRRPFTRVLRGRKSWLTLKDYININKLEVGGLKRHEARWILQLSTAADDRSPR
jgi:REP element-mobilizing transposase RayT